MTSVPVGEERPSGATARTLAQAKVNLFLRVLAREANGYHQLETLFCRVDLGDAVTVRTNVRGRSLDCAGSTLPAAGLGPIERNLAWRAATTYAESTGWPNAWAIEIDKTIPVGGGMGGGSADAGAVLRCLNAISPTPVDRDALLTLGGSLGADVPFLTSEAPLALGWGRGERLLALPPLPVRPVALITFSFGISTREAFGWLAAERGAAATQAAVFDVEQFRTWDGVAAVAHNDFEPVVAPRHAPIASALARLRSSEAAQRDRSAIAIMAGSGATVFIIARALPDDMFETHDAVSQPVRTRTASRVVAVEVSD